MRFYRATAFLFPRSFRLRLFAVCFVATLLPLLCYIGWGAVTGRLALAELVVLGLATLAGTLLALLGIGALLEPLRSAADAIEAIERGTPVGPLPQGRDVVGELLGNVRRAAEATEAREQALDFAAKEDALTGIRNRRGFLADIDALPEGQRGALALIDLDHFKRVNDRFGHDQGDRVLRAFAERLSNGVRRYDLVARWGGEEFAILFRDAIEEEASRVLERIARSLNREPLARLDGHSLTFSAGVSRFQQGAIGETLRLADGALYEAKHAGRCCACRAGDGELLVFGEAQPDH